MKIKAIILAVCLLLGLIVTSCSASKNCPAYGNASHEQQEDLRS